MTTCVIFLPLAFFFCSPCPPPNFSILPFIYLLYPASVLSVVFTLTVWHCIHPFGMYKCSYQPATLGLANHQIVHPRQMMPVGMIYCSPLLSLLQVQCNLKIAPVTPPFRCNTPTFLWLMHSKVEQTTPHTLTHLVLCAICPTYWRLYRARLCCFAWQHLSGLQGNLTLLRYSALLLCLALLHCLSFLRCSA